MTIQDLITDTVGLGGSCHWCTEAVFLSLQGVTQVRQGWLSSVDEESWFSEGIIIDFDPAIINLEALIEVHLHTHSCTANHSMRHKYRSAVYTFSEQQKQLAKDIIKRLQADFEQEIITRVLDFAEFNLSREQIQNYYYKNPRKPFCETTINPKLKILMQKFKDKVNSEKIPQDLQQSSVS